MRIKEVYRSNPTTFYLYVLLAIIIVIIIVIVMLPSIFYDQWIWKYYWGPIVADATGHSVSLNGIYAYEGYTLISEITFPYPLIIKERWHKN